MKKPALPALILLALAAASCSSADDRPGAGGLTQGENDRLEAAAERLESREPSPAQASAQALEQEVQQGIEAEQAAAPAAQ